LDSRRVIVYERELSKLVEDAFELSLEERQQLIRTLPLRDPLQELESRIEERQLTVETQ
jgi:hypothetical protein